MFLVVLLVMLSFGLFTACNSKASIKGDFKKSEYTISLSNAASPSEINFLNEFDVVGVEPANVKFVSSNEKVLAPKNVAGVFEGVASGDAYVFARINDKNIAKAKVYVKYKFSKPQNLKMTDGVLTFDPSYVIKKGGEQIFAQKYELKYKLNGDEEKNLIIENGQTSYTFIDKGIYDISLNALAQDNDKIDASEANSGKFTLGVMMPVSETDFSYTCSESVLNTITVFTWECDEENAKFDVYIDGLRVEKDLTRKEFRYDFNAYAGGEEITIKIVTKDGEGKRDDSSSDFKFKILTTPTVDYVYNGEDGYITWNNNDNVTKYIVSIYNENLSLYEDAQEVAPGEGLKEYLEWLYEGIYKVNVMAVGGTKNGLNYLNSKLSKDLEVGKIVAREPEVTLEGSTAKIKFQGDQYVTKYRISCEGKEKIYDTTQGDTTTFILPQLEVGEHYLQFTALPTPDQNSETNVKAFIFGSKAVMRVINSDPLPYKFYKLADFEDNIEHNLRHLNYIL